MAAQSVFPGWRKADPERSSMLFPWKQMKDGVVWFRHNDHGMNHPVQKSTIHLEEVTLIPTFGLHYMRAMREANGARRPGVLGSHLKPNSWRFWLESKWYGPSVARLRYRGRLGVSSINPELLKK